jgi:hypothetical protein
MEETVNVCKDCGNSGAECVGCFWHLPEDEPDFPIYRVVDGKVERLPDDIDERLLLALTRIPEDRKEEALEYLERLLNREDYATKAAQEGRADLRILARLAKGEEPVSG